jgi:hypothetical protein
LEHPWNKTLIFGGVFRCLPEVKAIESSAFLERAMGIEPIQMAKTKALPPASRFNWSHIGVNRTESPTRELFPAARERRYQPFD